MTIILAKTHFRRFAGKNYFCLSGFYHGKTDIFHRLAKTCEHWNPNCQRQNVDE